MAACAGPGDAPPPLTPVAELPDRNREVLEAYAEGGARWLDVRAAALSDPTLTRFLVENLTIVMVGGYGTARVAGIGEQHGAYEKARAELVALGPHSVQTLATMLVVGDDVVSFLAGDVLAEIGAPAADALVALLDEESWKTRRRAAETLARLPYAQAAEERVVARLARLLAEDSEWIVRAESAGALGARGERLGNNRAAREALQVALSDADPAVSETSAAALTRLDDPRAIPALLNYLERARRGGRMASVEAARDALLALSGLEVRRAKMGERNDRSPEEWRAWWKANRTALLGSD